jgi:hypothetical protein
MLNKMCPNKKYQDDLKQNLILHLLEKDVNILNKLLKTGEIYYYTYGYIRNQYHSSSSEFFKLHRNFVHLEAGLYYEGLFNENRNADMNKNFISEIEGKVNKHTIITTIDSLLDNKIDFFSAFLFRKYYYEWWDEKKNKSIKGRSYRKIEEEYSLNNEFKIDHMYIFNSVKETMNIIKEELKKEGLI